MGEAATAAAGVPREAATPQETITGLAQVYPNYLIEGHVFDCYSPQARTSVRNVWSQVREKIDDEQTQRVMLNLKDWEGDVVALRRQFDQWPIDGLKELAVATRDGTIRQIVRRD